MEILKDHDLTALNTFGIHIKGKFFAEIKSEADISELFSATEFKENAKLFLGGGSNVLFTADFDGIIISNMLKGIEIIEENPDSVLIRAMAGVVWHDLVTFAVTRGYWGIENLSLIPGTVGAAPMQNIGAYGVELKDTLETVEAIETATGEKRTFKNSECKFGYRDSVFKNELRDKYFITAITVKLKKQPQPNLSYKILSEYLKEHDIAPTNPKNIADAVANIRRSKLPDPKVIGNAGSFFKNIFVSKEKMGELMKTYPDMPAFQEDGITKIPTGWLIEQCGWKGKRVGNVGVHEKQALVLVNYGSGTGQEILQLAQEISASIKEKFNLAITPEVNII